MREVFKKIGEYSIIAFPDASSLEHLMKLKHEANEAIENPKDQSEYADCLLCLFAAAFKAGISYDDLVRAAEQKFSIVERRRWKKLPDGTYQHY